MDHTDTVHMPELPVREGHGLRILLRKRHIRAQQFAAARGEPETFNRQVRAGYVAEAEAPELLEPEADPTAKVQQRLVRANLWQHPVRDGAACHGEACLPVRCKKLRRPALDRSLSLPERVRVPECAHIVDRWGPFGRCRSVHVISLHFR
jgi:hypothetical protein